MNFFIHFLSIVIVFVYPILGAFALELLEENTSKVKKIMFYILLIIGYFVLLTMYDNTRDKSIDGIDGTYMPSEFY